MASHDEVREPRRRKRRPAAKKQALPPSAVSETHADETSRRDELGERKTRGLFPRDIKAAEWIMIAFTAITAVSGWASVFVARRQWEIMAAQQAGSKAASEQVDRSIEAAVQIAAAAGYQGAVGDRAVKVAERNAKTAENQLVTSQDTANRQLRAYVYAYSMAVNSTEVGAVTSSPVVMGVTGQTPAYDFRAIKVIAPGKFPLLRPFDDPVTPKGMTVTRSMLHPGTPLNDMVALNGPIDYETAESIRQDKSRIYVYGLITYRDAFGKQHHTRFCAHYGGAAGNKGQQCPVGDTAD